MKNRVVWRRMVSSAAIRRAAQEWRVAPWSAELMLRRGVSPAQLAGEWTWADGRNLPDMQNAVAIVRGALERGQRVRIHGDYDADGVTATAVMVKGLTALGFGHLVDYYIPNRFDEGYGLGEDAIVRAALDGVALVVTVDCGSSSPGAAAKAKDLGVTLIITDHHALPSKLPDVPALVNPVRDPSAPPLSGAGVALALVASLLEDEPPAELVGIAAVGTVADVVPLLGANRFVVEQGLAAIRRGAVAGVAELFFQAGRPVEQATAQDLAFVAGPRLNAAGRMGDASSAVQLLLSSDAALLGQLAGILAELNQERRQMERRIMDEAWRSIPRDEFGRLYPFTVICGDDWHEGVIGIAASRFREVLRRPVAVVAWAGQEGRGSARGVEGLDLIAHLRQFPELFSKLGGHAGAAGFSLPRQSAERLSQALSRNLSQAVLEQQYQGEPYDLKWDPDLSLETLWRDLEGLEPYGRGFESPRFLVQGRVRTVRRMGSSDEHVRLLLDGMDCNAVGFNLGDRAAALSPGDPVRFVATLETNWYRGKKSPQWRMTRLEGPVPRRAVPVHSGLPNPVPQRTVWVVDSDADVRRTARQLKAQPYHAGLSLGELILIREEAVRGPGALVVSQWRPWPWLLDWADAVIWLCIPRSQVKWEEAAALLSPKGQAWLAAEARARAGKAERLEMSRARLARSWRAWEGGRAGLVPGRAVFEELELTPALARQGERRSAESSYLYQMAARESLWDRRTPFRGQYAGEDERHGLD